MPGHPKSAVISKVGVSVTRNWGHAKTDRHLRNLKDDRDNLEASKLTRNDPYLNSAIPWILQESRTALNRLCDAIQILCIIHSRTASKTPLTWSSVYIKAMAGELADSPLARETYLSVKKMSSDTMAPLLDSLSRVPGLDLESVASELTKLIRTNDSSKPLRSEHNVQHSTVRTTVVGQKVSLSKHKATLSAEDAAYSKLVDRVDAALRDFLTKSLIRPKDLCLHEVLIFDTVKSCRDALGPAPRQTVERALSSPHDYLACDCCAGEGLSESQPPTAVLYQMYLESGNVINMADLWAAFQALMEPEEENGEERDENESL